MPATIDLSLVRLQRLPENRSDTWQAALVRMPKWIKEGEAEPYRPLLPVCRSALTGKIGAAKPLTPTEALDRATAARAVLGALLQLSNETGVGYRPGSIEVRDPELADCLRETLADSGVQVELVGELPLIDAFRKEMAAGLGRAELGSRSLSGSRGGGWL